MTIRVALADDQALVREGLKALLQRLGMEVPIEAEDGAALLAKLATQPIDVIISDIRMPGLDGIAMVRKLRSQNDLTPVVMLTTFDDSELLPAAIDAGAQAFLLKGASSEDLRSAIESAHRGERWLAPVVIQPLRERFTSSGTAPRSASLGERELEILRLLAGGYSNREIARSIHLAEGTVKNYVSEILVKLGTRDRTRAVLNAITWRII